MNNNIIVDDNIVLPPPVEGGISIQPEFIWSQNAGRTASALFVGDIKTVKITMSISWEHLNYEQVQTIRGAFSRIGKPFFWLTYTGDDGIRTRKRFYSTSPSASIKTYTNSKGSITGVSVDLVEC